MVSTLKRPVNHTTITTKTKTHQLWVLVLGWISATAKYNSQVALSRDVALVNKPLHRSVKHNVLLGRNVCDTQPRWPLVQAFRPEQCRLAMDFGSMFRARC